MNVGIILIGLLVLIIVVIIIAIILRIIWRALTGGRTAKGRHLESRASVRCKHCGQGNPAEALFCGSCGTSLELF